MGHAIARQRQFNPKDVFDDVHDLARVNPEAVAKQVVALARKKNSSDGDVDKATMTGSVLGGTVIAVIVTALVGGMTGSQNAKRDAMIAEWENAGNTSTDGCPTPWEVGAKDPTNAFLFVPWMAIPPVVTAVAAALTMRRRKKKAGKNRRSIPGAFETGMWLSTVTGIAMFAAQLSSNYSYCKKERAITASTTPLLQAV